MSIEVKVIIESDRLSVSETRQLDVTYDVDLHLEVDYSQGELVQVGRFAAFLGNEDITAELTVADYETINSFINDELTYRASELIQRLTEEEIYAIKY